MENVDYILKAGYMITMEDSPEPVVNGAVAVRGTKIVAAGTEDDIEENYRAMQTVGDKNFLMMPGLINTHTHAPMVYFRGMADDLPLKEWLENHIWPAEAKWLGPEFVRDATELACLEMVKAGVTAYNDMYFFGPASSEAVHKVGMRAVLGAGILDFPSVAAKTTDEYFSKAETFIKDFIGDALVTPCIAPHAPYTCGPEAYTRAVKLSEKYNVPVHTHLSETQWEVDEIQRRYGKSPVEHLESLGVLNEKMIAAHCVWLTEKEIEILARRGVSVSHCLESNLKLASGISPVVKMLSAGVKVTFGTDGAASNNDLDVLREMSTAAKLHKAVSGDPTSLNARMALLMATRWGAEALNMGDRLGRLRKGYLADIVMMNLHKPHLTPLYDVYSHVVYSAKSSDVEHVMINGRLVVHEGTAVSCPEEEIMATARSWAGKIKG
jgi:5-methylthioadenosine/S-adenosylhomocysteine deaminase